MFGDSNAFTESLFFSTIKNKLMLRAFSKAIPLSPYLEGQIAALLKSNHGRALSEDRAVQATKDLVDGTFEYLKNRNLLLNQYIDYSSGSFIDWPQDVVFTTVISPVAATYGDRILVVKEKSFRALDMNYWNKLHNDLWYQYTRDAGEFISFGYLRPEDLVGYQIRTGREKSWHRIETAFYKSVQNGKVSILVFSGKRARGDDSSCLDFNSVDKAYYHCDYRPGRVVTGPPALSHEKPQLMGVLILCRSQGSCDSLPLSEIKKYPILKGPIDFDMDSMNLTIQGQRVRFVPAEKLVIEESP